MRFFISSGVARGIFSAAFEAGGEDPSVAFASSG
jgi:hypothetical protein